jgi:NTP pyrophosphatase (non-canonical NTP hydrolase)
MFKLTPEFEELCDRMTKAWGERAQTLVAVEEMAELQVELLHWIRGRDSNIPEELADVIIMCGQLYHMSDEKEKIHEVFKYKIDRLQKKLDNNHRKEFE